MELGDIIAIILGVIVVSLVIWQGVRHYLSRWSSDDRAILTSSITGFIENKLPNERSEWWNIQRCMVNRITNNFSDRKFRQLNSKQVTELFEDTFRSCRVTV